MAQKQHSVYQRIRNVKSSLENAEQSFLDNKAIRGELDLMLAEAELQNLRRKKDFPWSWTRQILALCAAFMVALAGLGGWYYAQSSATAASEPVKTATTPLTPVAGEKTDNKLSPAVIGEEKEKNIIESQKEIPAAKKQLIISEADMRRLVQSARVELSGDSK